MNKETIEKELKGNWAGRNLWYYDEIGSTNDRVMELGKEGAHPSERSGQQNSLPADPKQTGSPAGLPSLAPAYPRPPPSGTWRGDPRYCGN